MCVVAVKKTKRMFGAMRNSSVSKCDAANTFSNLHLVYFREVVIVSKLSDHTLNMPRVQRSTFNSVFEKHESTLSNGMCIHVQTL